MKKKLHLMIFAVVPTMSVIVQYKKHCLFKKKHFSISRIKIILSVVYWTVIGRVNWMTTTTIKLIGCDAN